MPSTSFNFETIIESMQTAVGDLDSTKSQLDGYLAALRSELEAAIPGWVGEASAAYLNLQNAWNADQLKLDNALQDLSDALQQAIINYKKTEAANTSSFAAPGFASQ